MWGIHDTRSSDDPGPSGCGYYRIVLPFEQLKANGWKAGYSAGRPPASEASTRVIVGERLMRSDVLGEWRRLRRQHRLVYEIDDDVWNIDPVNAMAYRAFSTLSVLDAVETCCAVADLVTVTNGALAEMVRRKTGQREIRVIDNYVPGWLLRHERPRREHVTIGWAGGASHGRDLHMIAHAVRDVLDRDKTLQLHLIGSDYRPTFGIMNLARFTPWEDDPADFYKHIDFDIGLAPIISDTFNMAKSSLKAKEYGALGIPVVASDFGPYQQHVIDGVTGFLVRTPKQWRARIRELAYDADLRESMGAKAREMAAHHTIEGNWQKWASVYSELL